MTAAAFQHVDVLRRIADPGETAPTIDALAEEFGRDPSNFRKTLKLLEGDGLISREPGRPPAITDAGELALRGVDVAQGRVELPDTIVLRHHQARPHPLNPRKDFTSAKAVADGELLELTIIDRGLDHNLVIRAEPGPDGIYFIIAGERRWRAIGHAIERGALPADFPIRCLPRDVDDKDHLFAALGENMDRENLSELDEGLAFAHARDQLGVPTVEIAGRIHRTQKYVQDRIRLTTLPEEIQAAMREPRKLADGSRNPRHVTFTEARDYFQESRGDEPAGDAAAEQTTLDLIGGDDADDPLVVNGLRYPNATRAAEARRLMEGAVHVAGGGSRLMELPPQPAPAPRQPEPETDRALTPKARLALIELAHKVEDKGVALEEGGERAAYVGKYWTDQAFSDLAQSRLVRAIHLPGGTPPLAALTDKGLQWFAQNRVALPVTDGRLAAAQTETMGQAPSGRYVTPWLDEEARPPAAAPLADSDADTDAWDRDAEQIEADKAVLERVRAFVADPAAGGGRGGKEATDQLDDLGVYGPFTGATDGAVLDHIGGEIMTVDVNREWPNERADAIALLVAWALNLAFEAG